MNEILPFPKRQKLRVPAGWEIDKNNFYDLEPKEELLVEGNANNNGWSLFEEELLYFKYEKQNLILDMGWFPNYEHDGKFILRLIKDKDWQNRKIICETRSLSEITKAINDQMLNASKKNGYVANESQELKLQELRPYHGWKFIKNQFFDLNPSSEIKVKGFQNEDYWQFFHEDMLHLEWFDDAKIQIRLGWFPAHDPNGNFVSKIINENYSQKALVTYEPENWYGNLHDSAAEFVNQAMEKALKVKPKAN